MQRGRERPAGPRVAVAHALQEERVERLSLAARETCLGRCVTCKQLGFTANLPVLAVGEQMIADLGAAGTSTGTSRPAAHASMRPGRAGAQAQVGRAVKRGGALWAAGHAVPGHGADREGDHHAGPPVHVRGACPPPLIFTLMACLHSNGHRNWTRPTCRNRLPD